MPQLKIKEFKGLATNYDQDDIDVAYFQTCKNFKNKNSYTKIDQTKLTKLAQTANTNGIPSTGTTIPNPNNYYSNIHSGAETITWVWETGITALMTEDKFAKIPYTDQDWVTILIAKGTGTSGDFYRQVWMKEDGSNNWYNMSAEGNYSPTINSVAGDLEISDSFYLTDVPGTTILKIQGGKVLIYMPHDSFILSKMNRTFEGPSNWITSYVGYHIDRLSEPITDLDLGNTELGDGTPVLSLKSGRRLGCRINLQAVNFSAMPQKTKSATLVLGQYTTAGPLNIPPKMQYAHFEDASGKPVSTIFPLFQAALKIVATENSSTNQEFILGEEHIDGSYTGRFLVSTDAPTGVFAFTDIATPSVGWGNPPFNAFAPQIEGLNSCRIPSPWGSACDTYYRCAWYAADNDDYAAATWTVADGSTTGFEHVYEKAYVVVTGVLDEESEIIIGTTSLDLTAITEERFGIRSNLLLADYSNKRLTRINIYLKFVDAVTHEVLSDYELIQTYNLLNKGKEVWAIADGSSDSYWSETDLDGTLLSQNIAFTLDEKKFYQYNVLTGFSNIATIDGISIATIPGDSANFYYSVVGAGVMQPNLIYRANLLKDIPLSNITGVSTGNGFFIIFSKTSTYIMKVTPAGTVAAFSPINTLEEGAANPDAIDSMVGGALAAGLNGIHFLDGYKAMSLSLQIDNLIEGLENTAKLYYNEKDHYLLYTATSLPYILRYRFIDESWEQLDFEDFTDFDLDELNNVFSDKNGDISVLTDDDFWIYNSAGTESLVGELISSDITMDAPTVEKKFIDMTIDYSGQANVEIFLDGVAVKKYTLEDKATRYRTIVTLPIASNKLFKTFKYGISGTTSDFELYGIYLNFEYYWETSIGDYDQGDYTDYVEPEP